MVIERLLILALAVFVATPAYSFPPTGELELKAGQGSKYCLGCHDGQGAKHIGKSHSVDIDYRLAEAKSNGMLKHVSKLHPAVKLQNGKVVCTTCHDRNSALPAKLVMSNVKSELCHSCHNQ